MARGLTQEERQALVARRLRTWIKVPRILFNRQPLRYALVAWTMLVGVAVMVPLWLFETSPSSGWRS